MDRWEKGTVRLPLDLANRKSGTGGSDWQRLPWEKADMARRSR